MSENRQKSSDHDAFGHAFTDFSMSVSRFEMLRSEDLKPIRKSFRIRGRLTSVACGEVASVTRRSVQSCF